jgi:hypothetical protein
VNSVLDVMAEGVDHYVAAVRAGKVPGVSSCKPFDLALSAHAALRAAGYKVVRMNAKQYQAELARQREAAAR